MQQYLSRDCSLSYNEVDKLAESLSDGTVFGIISELKDIQNIKLASLSKERSTIVKSFEVSVHLITLNDRQIELIIIIAQN